MHSPTLLRTFIYFVITSAPFTHAWTPEKKSIILVSGRAHGGRFRCQMAFTDILHVIEDQCKYVSLPCLEQKLVRPVLKMINIFLAGELLVIAIVDTDFCIIRYYVMWRAWIRGDNQNNTISYHGFEEVFFNFLKMWYLDLLLQLHAKIYYDWLLF